MKVCKEEVEKEFIMFELDKDEKNDGFYKISLIVVKDGRAMIMRKLEKYDLMMIRDHLTSILEKEGLSRDLLNNEML